MRLSPKPKWLLLTSRFGWILKKNMRRYKRLSDAAKSGQSPAPSPYKVQVSTAQYQPAASQYQFPTWQPQYKTLETPQRSTARLQPANQPSASATLSSVLASTRHETSQHETSQSEFNLSDLIDLPSPAQE